MISKKLSRQMLDLLLIVFLTTGCSGMPAEPPTTTPTPTTGTITGWILDANGKPFVDITETGYVVLFCPGDNVGVECLHEGYEDMEPSVLLASICDIVNRADNCLVHLMTSASEIRGDGKYTIPFVHPGQYDLIVMIKSSGILTTLHLINVPPVQAGQVTRFDLPAK